MLRRPHYIFLGGIILLTLALLKLPSGTSARLKLAISGLFLPLYGLTSSARELSEKTGQAITPRAELQRQLEQLQKENAGLRARAMQAEELSRENQRLRQHFGFPASVPWKLKLARVVGGDPANWWRMRKINLGSRDGVTINL